MKYAKFMDKISVTDEMRTRILSGVEKKLAAEQKRRQLTKRWLSLAACLVLVVCCTVLVWRRGDGPVDVLPPEITTVSDASALSEAVGFPVEDIHGLPISPEAVTYTAIDDIGEIVYAADEGTAVYRIAQGEMDPSGDHNPYAYVTQTTLGGLAVTLKGNADGAYSLALWYDGVYTRSLSLTTPLGEGEWEALIAANT